MSWKALPQVGGVSSPQDGLEEFTYEAKLRELYRTYSEFVSAMAIGHGSNKNSGYDETDCQARLDDILELGRQLMHSVGPATDAREVRTIIYFAQKQKLSLSLPSQPSGMLCDCYSIAVQNLQLMHELGLQDPGMLGLVLRAAQAVGDQWLVNHLVKVQTGPVLPLAKLYLRPQNAISLPFPTTASRPSIVPPAVRPWTDVAGVLADLFLSPQSSSSLSTAIWARFAECPPNAADALNTRISAQSQEEEAGSQGKTSRTAKKSQASAAREEEVAQRNSDAEIDTLSDELKKCLAEHLLEDTSPLLGFSQYALVLPEKISALRDGVEGQGDSAASGDARAVTVGEELQQLLAQTVCIDEYTITIRQLAEDIASKMDKLVCLMSRELELGVPVSSVPIPTERWNLCILGCSSILVQSSCHQRGHFSESFIVLVLEAAVDCLASSKFPPHVHRAATVALHFSLERWAVEWSGIRSLHDTVALRQLWATLRAAQYTDSGDELLRRAKLWWKEHRSALLEAGIGQVRLPHLNKTWNVVDVSAIDGLVYRINCSVEIVEQPAFPSDPQAVARHVQYALHLCAVSDSSPNWYQESTLAKGLEEMASQADWMKCLELVESVVDLLVQGSHIAASSEVHFRAFLLLFIDHVVSLAIEAERQQFADVSRFSLVAVTLCCVLDHYYPSLENTSLFIRVLDNLCLLGCASQGCFVLRYLLGRLLVWSGRLREDICGSSGECPCAVRLQLLCSVLTHKSCSRDQWMPNLLALSQMVMSTCIEALSMDVSGFSAEQHKQAVLTLVISASGPIFEANLETGLDLLEICHRWALDGTYTELFARKLLTVCRTELLPRIALLPYRRQRTALDLVGDVCFLLFGCPLSTLAADESFSRPFQATPLSEIHDPGIATFLHQVCTLCKGSGFPNKDVREAFLLLTELPLLRNLLKARSTALDMVLSFVDSPVGDSEGRLDVLSEKVLRHGSCSETEVHNVYEILLSCGAKRASSLASSVDFPSECQNAPYLQVLDCLGDSVAAGNISMAEFAWKAIALDPSHFPAWCTLFSRSLAVALAASDAFNDRTLGATMHSNLTRVEDEVAATGASRFALATWPLQHSGLAECIVPWVKAAMAIIDEKFSSEKDGWFSEGFLDHSLLQQKKWGRSCADRDSFLASLLVLFRLKTLFTRIALQLFAIVASSHFVSIREEHKWLRVVESCALLLQVASKDSYQVRSQHALYSSLNASVCKLDDYCAKSTFAMSIAARIALTIDGNLELCCSLCNELLSKSTLNRISKSEKVEALYQASWLRWEMAFGLLTSEPRSVRLSIVDNIGSLALHSAIELDSSLQTEDEELLKVVFGTILGLEECRRKDPYHHKSLFLLSDIIFQLSQFHRPLPAVEKWSSAYFSGGLCTASQSLRVLHGLFDKRRPQIAAIWIMENPINPWDQLSARTAEFEYLRRKYMLRYLKLLELSEDLAGLVQFAVLVMECKHCNASVGCMLYHAVHAISRMLDRNDLHGESGAKTCAERVLEIYQGLTAKGFAVLANPLEAAMISVLNNRAEQLATESADSAARNPQAVASQWTAAFPVEKVAGGKRTREESGSAAAAAAAAAESSDTKLPRASIAEGCEEGIAVHGEESPDESTTWV